MRPLYRTKRIEGWIDELLYTVSETGLVFRESIDLYMEGGVGDRYKERHDQVTGYETRGDELRRDIEQSLYRETLIPDARREVLALLEELDDIINKFLEALWYFAIETPDIPREFKRDFADLTERSTSSVECLVLASRAFFRDPMTTLMGCTPSLVLTRVAVILQSRRRESTLGVSRAASRIEYQTSVIRS
jgi:hypothetical protein